MLTRRFPLQLSMMAGILFLIGVGGWQFSAPEAVHAQPDSSSSLQRPGSKPSPAAASQTPSGRELFGQHCKKCHGVDGTGSPARAGKPEIPNFTDASWQARRNEAQLLASILEGKGKGMPAWRGRISEEQARALTPYVRAFAPTTAKQKPEKQQTPLSRKGSEEEFRRLQKAMDELKKQSRDLSAGSADKERSKASESSQPAGPSKPSTPAAAGRELFRQHCMKCHGADGTGSQIRCDLPEIPNLTDPAWQARRSDAQLLASILEGKGKEMPPWRAKISEKQARSLVAYVRAFASDDELTCHGASTLCTFVVLAFGRRQLDAPFGQGLTQNILDLPIQAAQLFARPALECIEEFRVNP